MLKIKPKHHPKGQKVGALGEQTETNRQQALYSSHLLFKVFDSSTMINLSSCKMYNIPTKYKECVLLILSELNKRITKLYC